MTALALLALVVCAYQGSSLSYDGSECLGYVEFDLSSTSNVASLDGDVAADLSFFPVYIPYSCKTALRRYYCLKTFTSQANSSSIIMCASVCHEVLDSCKLLLTEAAAESTFGLYLYELFKLCADGSNTAGCLNVNASTNFPQDQPQCFYQTVVPDEHGASFLLNPSACAIPCPGQVFHNMYHFWHKLLFLLTIASIIGASLTTFTFANKYWLQTKRSMHQARVSSLRAASVFPVLMFCVGGLIQSVVNGAAFVVEIWQPRCRGNAEWRHATPMCVVQSVAILGCYFWSSCWSVVMAFESLCMVFWPLEPNRFNRQKIRESYLPVIFAATSTSLLAIHLNKPRVVVVQLPFCAKSTIEPLVDALFWIPAALMVTCSSVMMVAVLFRAGVVDRSNERASVVDQRGALSNSRSFCGLMFTRGCKPYLLRIFLLVLCYNSTVLFICNLFFDAQRYLSKYERNATNFYTCIFTYSITSPAVGREHCGDIQDWDVSQPLWAYTVYVIIVGSSGLIPFIVFGTDCYCRGLAACIKKKMSSSSRKLVLEQVPGQCPRAYRPSPLHILVASLPLQKLQLEDPYTPSPTPQTPPIDEPIRFETVYKL